MSTWSEAMFVAKSQQMNAWGTKKFWSVCHYWCACLWLSWANIKRSRYCYNQPSYIPSVPVSAQPCPMQSCYSPVRASREARAPIGTNAQMGKQAGTNWEMRATFPALLCFCLCKEKEMFIRPISQNDLPWQRGILTNLPLETFACAHRVQGSPVAPLLSMAPFTWKKGMDSF